VLLSEDSGRPLKHVGVNCVWFGLVYLFIHSVTYVILDTSVTDYNLQNNLQGCW